MSFVADKQTLEDLNLLGKYRPHSIFGIFNQVKTHGGGRLLESMFNIPLTDAEAINTRAGIFQYFHRRQLAFPFSAEQVGKVENYLGMGTGATRMTAAASVLKKKLMGSFIRDEQYQQLYEGLTATIVLLQTLRAFVDRLEEKDSPYQARVLDLKALFSDGRLTDALSSQTLSLLQVARYDHLLKQGFFNEMEMVLEIIYELDLYIAVSGVARARGFAYAMAFPKEHNIFRASALRHPALDKGVGNSLAFYSESNLVFLTGANMAGKSTFMKSFGIAVYLAHMGFPVAAATLEFSVRDGLYSSINVADNLAQGYSHFYAEVLRVKTVAEAVSSGKFLVVLFDELFKGTNVKDAYDATLAVTRSFSDYRNCCFVISTHIIEVGEALPRDAIQFSYLPTVMEGHIPRYTYRLTEGITNDRHGMMIIENEKILDLLRESPSL
ncbi:DNA mismatch repair protein [Flavitalea sp. BT771]|uniref:MutS-related protein n=1 Tax=Flavitalea sp. BT771 TaxID=3063329 RepID=UPI0026E43AF9|nr:DNA mismatch repair protein [Flavitalea sp. BT771]MDO6432351.1 DNA mismatch repair protein [Flavitalea sp. BT771]MDV6221261.1 DNA mismatch repair protein [Flavitalea sp. BT771]